jgi:hypothetical protein
MSKIPFDRPGSLIAANATVIAGLLILLSITSISATEFNPPGLRPPSASSPYDDLIENQHRYVIPYSENFSESIKELQNYQELRRLDEDRAFLSESNIEYGNELKRLRERNILTLFTAFAIVPFALSTLFVIAGRLDGAKYVHMIGYIVIGFGLTGFLLFYWGEIGELRRDTEDLTRQREENRRQADEIWNETSAMFASSRQ